MWPISSLIERFAAQLETHGARIALRSAVSWIAIFLRRRWQRVGQRLSSLVPEFVTKARTLLGIKVRPLPARRGILFVGYVEAGLGLGESLRGLLAAAAARDVQFGIYPFRFGVETRNIGPFMREKYDRSHCYDLNVIEVAADQVPTVFGSLDSRLYAGNYNVLRTYWELPKAPAAWVPMLCGVDEIWVPNEFVRNAFRNVFPGAITLVPPCVVIDETAVYPGRRKLGLDDRRFYYLFSFDYYSYPDRKNPLGVLKTFQDAFRKGDENVGLIIKSTGAPAHYPEIKQRMQAAMEVDPRIKIFDRTMTRREVLGLIQSCDCYVSLHRAEGFGLAMVEAMNFGKAVIGTDFSGSTDFLSEQTGFPVSCELRPVQPNEYVWTEGQSWAEPNHQKAIELLKLVFENPQLGTKKGNNARAFVRQRYGKDAVGAVLEARIAEIAKIRRQQQ
jgi:glycosyltransferase involved in cell wall biosynthesis